MIARSSLLSRSSSYAHRRRHCSSSPSSPEPAPERLGSPSFSGHDPQDSFEETARKVAETIRRRPRWESILLELFPSSHVLHPPCSRLVLRSLSASNRLLSLRFLLWVSRRDAAGDPPILAAADAAPLLDDLAGASAWKPLLIATRSMKCGAEIFLRLCDGMAAEEALEMATQKESLDISLQAWNTALSASLPRRTGLVWRFYGLMTCCGVSGDASTAGCLVSALTDEGKLGAACAYLFDLAKNGMVPDATHITRLIDCLSRVGSFSAVSWLLHFMIAAGRPPSIFTYQAIIRGLRDNGMGEEALRVFRTLGPRGYIVGKVTYPPTMIDGLCKMGRMEEAMELLLEMGQKGMEPNEYTYNALINGYCKSGDFDQARSWYEEMLDKGFKESTMSCNIMISGLCLHDKLEEAAHMLDEMPKRGIGPDVITYNTVIQGFCEGGRADGAKRLYRELPASGIAPTVSTYTPLIRAICEEGDAFDAAELVEEMEARGLEPLVCTGNYLISGFCRLGEADVAMSWLKKMMGKNHKPELQALGSLVRCLSVSGAMLGFGYLLEGSDSHELILKLCHMNKLGSVWIGSCWMDDSVGIPRASSDWFSALAAGASTW